MDRRASIVAALLLAPLLVSAKSADKPVKKSVAIHLRSIDAGKRRAMVELHNVSRPPAPNLFTFTDARDRHFVAVTVHCEEAAESVRVCELEIPAGYEKHPLKTLELHLHGLHGRTVAVPDAEIAAAGESGGAQNGNAAPDGGTP
jgi:hypothetical protein